MISKDARTKILANTCRIKGPTCTVTSTTIDHVHPKSLGGNDKLSNLQASCYECNQWKANQFIIKGPGIPVSKDPWHPVEKYGIIARLAKFQDEGFLC